jgi:uncharacterized protein (DUF305 family)
MLKNLLALILTSASLSACGQTPASPPPSDTSAPVTVTSATDLAWAQLQIALNNRALQILHLVPARAGDNRLTPFAAAVTSGHQDENVKLQSILDQIAAPQGNPHEGHNMPGMATPEQIASLSQLHTDSFDTQFIARMREHLTQCRMLAQSMQTAGALPEAKELARRIETDRDRDLQFLSTWPTPP